MSATTLRSAPPISFGGARMHRLASLMRPFEGSSAVLRAGFPAPSDAPTHRMRVCQTVPSDAPDAQIGPPCGVTCRAPRSMARNSRAELPLTGVNGRRRIPWSTIRPNLGPRMSLTPAKAISLMTQRLMDEPTCDHTPPRHEALSLECPSSRAGLTGDA